VLEAGADVNMLSADPRADAASDSSDSDSHDGMDAPPPPPPPPPPPRLGVLGQLALPLRLAAWFRRASGGHRTAGRGGDAERPRSPGEVALRCSGGGGGGEDRVSPLYVAARCGNVRMVELLLSNGA
jgi:hypothetical protein